MSNRAGSILRLLHGLHLEQVAVIMGDFDKVITVASKIQALFESKNAFLCSDEDCVALVTEALEILHVLYDAEFSRRTKGTSVNKQPVNVSSLTLLLEDIEMSLEAFLRSKEVDLTDVIEQRSELDALFRKSCGKTVSDDWRGVDEEYASLMKSKQRKYQPSSMQSKSPQPDIPPPSYTPPLYNRDSQETMAGMRYHPGGSRTAQANSSSSPYVQSHSPEPPNHQQSWFEDKQTIDPPSPYNAQPARFMDPGRIPLATGAMNYNPWPFLVSQPPGSTINISHSFNVINGQNADIDNPLRRY